MRISMGCLLALLISRVVLLGMLVVSVSQVWTCQAYVTVSCKRWSTGYWCQLQCMAFIHQMQQQLQCMTLTHNMQQQYGGSSWFQQGPGVTKNKPKLWCNCWLHVVILWATRWFSGKLRGYIKKPTCQRPGNSWYFKLIDWCEALN